MRYEKGRKLDTRRRILDIASRQFRENGIDGTGLASIMTEVGLTNGAFYAHFVSKEALVRAALIDALEDQLNGMTPADGGAVDLGAIITAYLTPEHRDDRAGGCPSAAMLSEIARRPEATRTAYTTGLRNILDLLSTVDGSNDPALAANAIAIFALALGTLQLSRAVNDPGLSEQILASGIDAARLLLDVRNTVLARSAGAARHGT